MNPNKSQKFATIRTSKLQSFQLFGFLHALMAIGFGIDSWFVPPTPHAR